MGVARPLARKDELVVRELDGETLVYDLDTHGAHCLNETAAAVWRACDGATPPARIAAQLDYDEEVVRLALEELWKLNLLAGEAAPERAAALSRRRLLKTALVALPVAATIAAPPASQAASCAAEGQPCVTTQDCCGGMLGPLRCPEGTCVSIGTTESAGPVAPKS